MKEATAEAHSSVSVSNRHIIKRPRLTRTLDESNARIVLLVAPAGYGKTTLAREWLSERGRQAAWYQANASSRDIAAFALGIYHAATQILASAGDTMTSRLRASSAPDAESEVLANLLVADLGAWPRAAWLVVDDYHRAAVSEASELFIDVLASSTSTIQLLLISRVRPKWATARRRMYGEVCELDREALTLTSAEAATILKVLTKDEASRLVESSKGWPAIIGLASMTQRSQSVPAVSLQADLFDYFAEELYRSASPSLQRGVTLLSLVPDLTADIAKRLLGPDHGTILREGMEAGFLSSHGTAEIAMHPLIRDFLRQRFRDQGVSDREAIRHVATVLIELEQWDQAFDVVTELEAFDLLDFLIVHSLDRLLDDNRLATLQEWIDYADSRGHASPFVQLVAAELALRRGVHAEARALALEVVDTLAPDEGFRARAHLVAGRATSLLSQEEDAFAHLAEAFAAAVDVRTRSDAAWSRFTIGFELERPDIEQLYHDLSDVPVRSYDHSIRILTARSFLSALRGSVDAQVLAPDRAVRLSYRVHDPMTRSSFLNRQAWAAVVSGQYDAAATILEEELAYARRVQLDFVVPHALVLSGAAELGRRNFDAALAALTDAGLLAPEDPYVQMACLYVRSRLYSALHEFDEAAALTATRTHAPPNRALYGEYLAAHALATACLGKHESAIALADYIENLTTTVEARTLARGVRAIVATRHGIPDSVAPFFAYVEERGAFDLFVTAYRAEPALLDLVAPASRDPRVDGVLERAHDLGLPGHRPGIDAELAALTPRELEVLTLLAEGLPNREISQRLFISEVTVKAHLRHVFDKLEVRSRTEAAVKAALVLARRRG